MGKYEKAQYVFYIFNIEIYDCYIMLCIFRLGGGHFSLHYKYMRELLGHEHFNQFLKKVSNPIIIADIRKIFFLVKNLQLYNLLRGKEP